MSYTIVDKKPFEKRNVLLTLRDDATGEIIDGIIKEDYKKSVYSILSDGSGGGLLDEHDNAFLKLCQEENYVVSTYNIGFKVNRNDGVDDWHITGPQCGDEYAWTMLFKHTKEKFRFNPNRHAASNAILDNDLYQKIQNSQMLFSNYFMSEPCPLFNGIKPDTPKYVALNNYCNLMRAHVYMLDARVFVNKIIDDLKVKKLTPSYKQVQKLYKIYDYCKDYEDFCKNPYVAISKCEHMNPGEDEGDSFFQMIDTCGGMYGLSLKDRWNGNMWWFVKKALCSEGDTCVKRVRWSNKNKRFMDIVEQIGEQTVHDDIKAIKSIDDLLVDMRVGNDEIIRCLMPVWKQNKYQQGEVFCLKKIYKQELAIAKKLKAIQKSTKASKMFDRDIVISLIAQYEKSVGKNLSAEQHDAVVKCLVEGNVSGVGGGPGNGKSLAIECIKYICDRTSVSCKQIEKVVVAPTGKAANKIKGSTMHSTYYKALYESRLSDDKDESCFKLIKKSTGKLKYQCVIIDETSMCDVDIVHKFLSLCDDDIKLIVVGDKHQLPSVGYGEFFHDLIEAEIPFTYLTKNFRFEGLVEMAEAVKNGTLGDNLSLLNTSNILTFIDTTNCDIDGEVMKIYNQNRNENLQIITPWNKKVDEWNNTIHRKLVKECGGSFDSFLHGEKLVGRKNYYNDVNGVRTLVLSKGEQCRYISGDSIMFVRKDDGTVAEVPRGYVDLAHAVNVHKSQGDEWNKVVVVIDKSSPFTTRELLYTAITRPKTHLYLISSIDTLKKCVKNKRFHRLTMLRWILKKKITQL